MARGTVAAPGAWNALVARAIAAAGFDACYVSGGATANAAGVPDTGILGRDAFIDVIARVDAASGLPVIADADTGFGDPAATVAAYEAAGAAAMHMEDQVFPKRCGHLEGKEVIDATAMTELVAAAVGARTDDAFMVIARTDARSVEGLDSAIERGAAYRAAGADMVFPEGLESAEEFERFADGCPGLLLANMTEFGKTPDLPVSRFAEMGYDLVIFPITAQRVAMAAITECLRQLRATGTAVGCKDRMQTRQELYDLLGYDPAVEWEPTPTPPRG